MPVEVANSKRPVRELGQHADQIGSRGAHRRWRATEEAQHLVAPVVDEHDVAGCASEQATAGRVGVDTDRCTGRASDGSRVSTVESAPTGTRLKMSWTKSTRSMLFTASTRCGTRSRVVRRCGDGTAPPAHCWHLYLGSRPRTLNGLEPNASKGPSREPGRAPSNSQTEALSYQPPGRCSPRARGRG